VLTIHEFLLIEDVIRCKHSLIRPLWNLCLTSANHLLLAINASVNFLIYCSIGKRFKCVLRRFFLENNEKDLRRFELSSKNFSQSPPQDIPKGETVNTTTVLPL